MSAARADQKPADALKDGKLERLEIRELQGGFAGFTGTYYVVESDGSWSKGPVLPLQERMGEPTVKGKLSAEQMRQLAKDLARHDPATLPSYGEPVVNPKVVKVRLGTKVSILQPQPGKFLQEEDQAIRARYQGIVQAVKMACHDCSIADYVKVEVAGVLMPYKHIRDGYPALGITVEAQTYWLDYSKLAALHTQQGRTKFDQQRVIVAGRLEFRPVRGQEARPVEEQLKREPVVIAETITLVDQK